MQRPRAQSVLVSEWALRCPTERSKPKGIVACDVSTQNGAAIGESSLGGAERPRPRPLPRPRSRMRLDHSLAAAPFCRGLNVRWSGSRGGYCRLRSAAEVPFSVPVPHEVRRGRARPGTVASWDPAA